MRPSSAERGRIVLATRGEVGHVQSLREGIPAVPPRVVTAIIVIKNTALTAEGPRCVD
jgi:hypothetical protein